WLVAALLLLGLLIWAAYAGSRLREPGALLAAAVWVGKCEAVVEQATDAIASRQLDSGPLAHSLAASQRLRTEIPVAPGPWFPAKEGTRLLEDLDTQLRGARDLRTAAL